MKVARRVLIGLVAPAAMVAGMAVQTTVIAPPKAHADLIQCATESGAEAYWDDLWGDCD
jgi:hypothetical protein